MLNDSRLRDKLFATICLVSLKQNLAIARLWPAQMFGAGDNRLGNATSASVSSDAIYCLSHLVPLDHSIE